MSVQLQVFSRWWQRFLCLDWRCTGGASRLEFGEPCCAGPPPLFVSQHYMFAGEVHWVVWTLCFIIHFTGNMRGIGHCSLFAIYSVELGTAHAVPTRSMVGVPCPAGPPAPVGPYIPLCRLENVGCALWSEWNGVGCLYTDFSTFHRHCVLTLHLRGWFLTYARRFCLYLEVSYG